MMGNGRYVFPKCTSEAPKQHTQILGEKEIEVNLETFSNNSRNLTTGRLVGVGGLVWGLMNALLEEAVLIGMSAMA